MHVPSVAVHGIEHVLTAGDLVVIHHAGPEEAIPVVNAEAIEVVNLVPELGVVCMQSCNSACEAWKGTNVWHTISVRPQGLAAVSFYMRTPSAQALSSLHANGTARAARPLTMRCRF